MSELGLKSLPKIQIKYPIKSLIKALCILEELGENGTLGVTDLGQRLGIRLSTVHRLLSTLKGKGYVLSDPATSKYMLGGMIARLGDEISRQSPLLKHGTLAVEELSRECNETVNLAVLDGIDVVYVARQESRHTLRTTAALGGRWPAHVTALGKVCLADLPDDEVLRLYHGAKKLHKLTPNTITNVRSLLAELAVVRREGIARDNEENSLSVYCLAVPVRGPSGRVVAALSISAPKARMGSDRLNLLKPILIRAGADLSAKLGASPVAPGPSRNSSGRSPTATVLTPPGELNAMQSHFTDPRS
jgi:DNA-binding IclR family transcriptional regulator